MFLSVALGGCASDAPPTNAATTNVAAPTTTPAAAPTVEPSGEAETAEQTAWKACAAVAQDEYVSKNPGSSIEPFLASRDTFQDFGDGAPRMMVGVHPAQPVAGSGGIVVVCTMSDTSHAATVVSWTIKDV
ncbi:hypothetical protein [Streptomyces sp. L7]|uniref:hypothetical protein n=1 Tax=Streptomyces sp. L7 TaxID=3423954 RepID=UPI003D95D182